MATPKYVETTITNQGGQKWLSKSDDHEIIIEGASTMGGDNNNPDPLDALLASLGACKLIIAKSFAKERGIKINDISLKLTGKLDNYGFEFLSQEVKEESIGFTEINTEYFIDADNSNEEIDEFVEFVESTCPVLDTIINTPEFSTKVNYN